MTFQEKLVVLRKMMGRTQDDIASIVGVSRQAVYKWESGQSYPEVTTLVKVRDFYRDYGGEFNLTELSLDNLLDDDFVIALPEKKRRRKRMNKDIQREIEAIVEAEEEGTSTGKTLEDLLKELSAPAPKAAAPAPKAAAPKAAPAPAVVVEEVEVDEDLEAEVAEAAAPAVAEEAAPEKKKKGFLFFGRK